MHIYNHRECHILKAETGRYVHQRQLILQQRCIRSMSVETLAILKLVANTLQLIVMIITTNDYCDISSGCEHVPVVCNDHSQCTNKSCDPDMCLYSDIVQR